MSEVINLISFKVSIDDPAIENSLRSSCIPDSSWIFVMSDNFYVIITKWVIVPLVSSVVNRVKSIWLTCIYEIKGR